MLPHFKHWIRLKYNVKSPDALYQIVRNHLVVWTQDIFTIHIALNVCNEEYKCNSVPYYYQASFNNYCLNVPNGVLFPII